MALLSAQPPVITGTALTFSAASAGGDTLYPVPAGALLVRNSSTAAITVTIVTPGNTRYGQADPDVPVVVGVGVTAAIGPLPQELRDSTDGQVRVTYSAVASVTVAVLTL